MSALSVRIAEFVTRMLESVAANPFSLFGILYILAFVNLYFPPVPLETMVLFAGFLSGTGHGSLSVVILAATAGMSCGSFLLYDSVKCRGTAFLQRTPLRRVTDGKFYDKAAAWFQRYGIYAVFLGKLVPGMSLATVICCGVFRWPTRAAAGAIVGSNLVFFGALALAGRFLGVYWGQALPWLSKISLWVMLAGFIWLVIRIIPYLFNRNRKRV